MKFSLFAHVERYDGATPWPQLYGELTELVQTAEDGGFAAFWTGEHYGMEFTVGPNPLTLLVHLAAQTRDIRLVTGNIVAPFWHPVRLASEAALADVLTNGRIELGIARGAYQFEFDRLMDGMNAMQGGSHLRELGAPAAPAVGRRRRARGRELDVPGHDQRPEADPRGRAADLDRRARPRLARLRGRERLRRLLHPARPRTTARSRTWSRSSRRHARHTPTSRARG